ncbi:MAG TPA: AAA family ATPase [Solirubrobacteraceae bacterium]|nr:AAA family ATPase [Solirubrobacteraceae bacterium]
MYLKSLTLKGFKSFPDRTRLDFGAGVSVVVGPNGSGKSNVTDAVLWAMGEQSPLAVRGQSMQDVIFGGGHGVAPRGSAEVEIVLDNSDGAVELPVGEISIVRRLDRNGEGGYRLNGARCRLTDVIEVLSDTGLGKEAHSVISQGKVDAIVTSKPRDRRLLIEEAAGLGKHRKRRRRARLKLERTQENLDRALDIEREARTRVRPLKRQAEAAELHQRLERQILQARLELARDAAAGRRGELLLAEAQVAEARAERDRVEVTLQETIDRRGAAERALAERAERHDALSRRAYEVRSAGERLELRAEQVETAARTLAGRIERVHRELRSLEAAGADDGADGAEREREDRIGALEGELAEIEARRELEIEQEIAELRAEQERQVELARRTEAELAQAVSRRAQADEQARGARERLTQAERVAQDARRQAAGVGAELAAANEFLRAHVGAGGGHPRSPKALGEELRVREGYELALAAALGGRLDAALVADVGDAQAVLDQVGPDGGAALLSPPPSPAAGEPGARRGAPAPPAPGAERLLDLLSGPPAVLAVAERLLRDAWVVRSLERLEGGFDGIAATREGRVWFAASGELRQLGEGGSERVLARRNERDRLIGGAEQAAQAELAAGGECRLALEEVRAAEAACTDAEDGLREAERRRLEAGEARRRTEWLIEQRRLAPAQGALAVRRGELEGELAAERRQAERRERERLERLSRIEQLRGTLAADTATAPAAERLGVALGALGEAVRERLEALERELADDRLAGEQMAGELRACAAREAEIQAWLRTAGEAVTAVEVAAQRVRDQAEEAEIELKGIAEQLGESFVLEEDGGPPGEISGAASAARAHAGPEPRLDDEELHALTSRVQRLSRRREQLGPVNPLAQEEYAEALAHVEELERQRGDLETALRELQGVIRETDRQIQETFEETFDAAARNFGELVADVFPGGTGSLKLVTEERGPSPVLGGQPLPDREGGEEETIEAAAEAEAEAELEGPEDEALPGVEIEITPAGKATKRLSLLSGGEKSMTALAFLFAVFLARPCPFYILDEVEAALDDLNLDRFLALLRRYCDRAQFIVITHQKRTMEAADWLYGVSMGADGVSKVLSRRLPDEQEPADPQAREPAEGPESREVAALA